MKNKTKRIIIEEIADKVALCIKKFQIMPDVLLISEKDNEKVKASKLLDAFEVIIVDNIDKPILVKK